MKKLHTPILALAIILFTLSTNTMAGGKSSDAYFVKVDRDTTTQNSEQSDPEKQVTGKQTSATASGQRTYEPIVIRKRIDKASPASPGAAKKLPGTRKTSDVTLKRGVIE